MNLSTTLRDIRKLVDRNAPVILTGMAVSGAFVTTYFTYKGTQKSTHEILDAEAARANAPEGYIKVEHRDVTLSNAERVQLTWKNYVPAAATLAGTSACMVMATKIGLDRTAAMAGALVISERTYDQYKDKVKETLGENKHTKVSDAVAQDRVTATANPNSHLVLPDSEQWCFDMWSGRYFRSTMEEIKQAVNSFNEELLVDGDKSLSDFYEWLGLDSIQQSDHIGWRAGSDEGKSLLEIEYTSVLKDNHPCIAIQFKRAPMPNFQNPYS